MGVVSFSDESVSTVSAARLFKAWVLDAPNIFLKLFPKLLVSVSIVEGDGGPGTIKEYCFSKSAWPHYSYVRELHHVIDKENFVDEWTWSEGGDMGTKLTSYAGWCKFEPTSNGGCIFKYGAECKHIDGVDYIDGMKADKDLFVSGFKVVEAYLLANK